MHPALGPSALFLNDILAYTREADWNAKLHVGDLVEVHDRGWPQVPVVDIVDGKGVVEVDGVRTPLGDDDYPHIISSPHAEGIWERHQQAGRPDGVAWSDDALGDELQQRLGRLFDTLCERPADYHPGSHGTVRDLVHPSLYPYIEGLSTPAPGRATLRSPAPTIDRWGPPPTEALLPSTKTIPFGTVSRAFHLTVLTRPRALEYPK